MKKQTFLFLFLVASYAAHSQKPADILDKWASVSPIEKAYLHFDRDNYLAGETAWFKAYLYSDFQPDTISTTLYVELLKDSSTILSRIVLPVFLGSTNGQIELPDTLATGNYIIRAYTATMLNVDPAHICRQHIFIYGKNKTTVSESANENPRLEFFPEGGNFINGYTNSIAFKATDKNGLPVQIAGNILNEKNEVITNFTTYHDGMGMFDITPSANTNYYATIDGSSEKYLLPASINKGIAIALLPHPQGSFFEIKQALEEPGMQAAYMIGQMQHHIVFRQNFTSGKKQLEGVINTQHLHSGILQVTVFNKDNIQLAERVCFVDNKEYILDATIKEDTIDFSARAKNRISLHFKDTVQGSFSVSVIDNDYSSIATRENNIFTSLLLTSDIKGYVHNPAYYFSANNDSVKTALDLVMMTNGWRRFKWEKLLTQASFPAFYKDNAYITLQGNAMLQGTKKPFPDKQLLLLMTGSDGKRITQLMQTDNNGNFALDSMIFFDRTRLLFSDVRGKKSQYIDINMGNDSIRKGFQILPIALKSRNNISTTVNLNKWKMDYDAIEKANGILLQEIRLKVQKKNPLQIVDERYTNGMFSGEATKAIDLVNTDEANPYQNIFDYLQSRVNGLQVMADGFDYSLFYRQGPSVSSMGNIPMTLFLDEIETDASVIATIPASQVALVKVYNTFEGGWGNAPGGVLAVYTKKGQDYTINTSFANHRIYNGYSIIKEFYAPDYKPGSNTVKGETKPDNRITLLWRPNVLINNISPVLPISFYNSDRTKEYKIIMEGITVSGKMLSIEKIITPTKKPF